MAVQLGFNLAADARSAAEQFIQMLGQQAQAVTRLSDSISSFDSDGKLISETFKAITASGQQVFTTLKQTATGFELVSQKVDSATSSLKALEAQEKARVAAQRAADASTAEAALGKALDKPSLNANQLNATEAAVQKVKAAIESGSVSLARFQQLYAQIQNNPKKLIPNLSAEEAELVRSLRSIEVGFDKLGRGAKNNAEKISISWQGMVRLFEAQVIKRMTGALQSAFVDGINSAKDFSIRIAEIETISQRSGLATSDWVASLRGLSAQFGNPQTDVAEAAYQALSNQVTRGAETFQFLGEAAKFSKASVSTLADSVNLASSVIKGFNIPVSETGQVFASFFKTIELGRLRAKDLADTYGRSGTVAAELGVSYNELNAVLATLTNRGQKVADAQTLISNVLLKLLRPTDEMKRLFEEWGVASGQAAIATFGFSGVLEKLDAEAQKGSTRLGELFNQIRAVRGIFGLTGGGFVDFKANLDEIENAKESYENAADIVTKSFGDRLKVQMNRISVFFSEEFGDGVVKSFVKMGEALGGFDNVLRILTRTLTPVVTLLGPLAVGIIAAKVAIGTLTLVTTTAATAQTFLASAFAATTGAAQTATVTMAGFTAALGILAGGFAAGVALHQIFSQEDLDRGKQITAELKKQAEIRLQTRINRDPQTSIRNEQFSATTKSFDAMFKLILTGYSLEQQKATENKTKAIQNLKEVTEATKIAAKAYSSSVGSSLNELRRQVTDSRSIIEQSLKSTEALARKTADAIFETRLKFASDGRIDSSSGFVIDDQKIRLLQQRIKEVEGLARQELQKGTKESLQEARRFFDELRKLEEQVFGEQEAKRRREFDERVRRGTQTPVGIDFDPITGQSKARFEFVTKTADLERQLTRIKNEQLAVEEKIRAIERLKIKDKEAQISAEKSKRDVVEQALSAIEKLSALDSEGKLKQQFKGTELIDGEKIDKSTRLMKEFEREAQRIKEAIKGEDVTAQATIFDVILKQRQALQAQLDAALKEDKVKQAAEILTKKREEVNTQIAELKNAAGAGDQKINLGLKELIADLDTVLNQVGKITSGNISLDKTKKGVALALGQEVKDALAVFEKNTTAENLDKLKAKLEEFSISFGKLANKVVANDQPLTSFFENLKKAFESLDLVQAGLSEREGTKNKLTEFRQEAEKLAIELGKSPNLVQLIDAAAGQSAPVAAQNIKTITNSVLELITQLDLAKTKMDALGGTRPAVPGPAAVPPAPGGIFGGPVKYMSEGGFVGYNPRGSDTRAIMADPEEFMMNRMATRQFAPILQAMNMMKSDLLHTASPVTSMGDITINVQGGSTEHKTLRNIGKGLQREIRRGIIPGFNKVK